MVSSRSVVASSGAVGAFGGSVVASSGQERAFGGSIVPSSVSVVG